MPKKRTGTESTTEPSPGQQRAGKLAKTVADPMQTKKEQLKAFLLSPAASTESELNTVNLVDEIKPLQDSEITVILDKFSPHHRTTRDRLGAVPVSTYIIQTYRGGLPNFASNASLQHHTIRCIRTIFDKVPNILPADARMVMDRLVDAYTACQAEQGRVIDSLYGILSGRDKGLKEQCLTLVDELKQRVLDEISRGADAHTQNAYRMAIGVEVGLRGLASARTDRLAPHYATGGQQAKQLASSFRERFTIDDLVANFIFDVNQQDRQAQRIIDRMILCCFAMSEGQKNDGFDPHSIYHDPEVRSGYVGEPAKENKYQPFLNKEVALDVLLRVFEI